MDLKLDHILSSSNENGSLADPSHAADGWNYRSFFSRCLSDSIRGCVRRKEGLYVGR